MRNEKAFLDFLYVGAPRCGSTWLAASLEEHPGVWIPHNKELHFFNDRLVSSFEYKYPRGIDFYKSYFLEAPPRAKLGELSPFYYYDPNAAYRIHTHFPDVKIIIFLRNPADMLYSLYLVLRSREFREPTFERELAKSPQLLDLGFFHRLLTPYFDWFPRENIFVAVFEEFFGDEETRCRDLYRFLGIDEDFRPSALGRRINSSSEAPAWFVSRLRGSLIHLFNTKQLVPLKELLHRLKLNTVDYSGSDKRVERRDPSGLDRETRRRLLAGFGPDLERLEGLLGRNLDVLKT